MNGPEHISTKVISDAVGYNFEILFAGLEDTFIIENMQIQE